MNIMCPSGSLKQAGYQKCELDFNPDSVVLYIDIFSKHEPKSTKGSDIRASERLGAKSNTSVMCLHLIQSKSLQLTGM